MSLLPLLLLLPLLGVGGILLLPADRVETQKIIGLGASCATFLLSLGVYLQFNSATPKYQMVSNVPYLQEYGINFILGVDGISIFLVLLTTLLVPLCLLAGWTLTYGV